MSAEPASWGAKDMGEPLEVPVTMVDVTKPDRGTLAAADGTGVGALVDDDMRSKTDFGGSSAELVWTSRSGPVAIGQYTLTGASTKNAPRSWTLSGSLDGTTWVELDAREGQSFTWDTQTRPFTAPGRGAFTRFKLALSTEGEALSLSEVELFVAAGGLDGLSLTPAVEQRVPVGTTFSGVLATIAGAGADASDYAASVDYGDGIGPVEASLRRDDLGGWQVTAPHDFAAPGTYTAAVTVSDGSGATSQTSASVVAYRDETLTGAFDNVCIGDLGRTAASCDEQGNGYFRDKLAADGFVQGETHAIAGTPLTFDLPAVAAGAPDNITGEGQTVRLDLGAGATQLAFVGTATERARQPEAVLRFTDGSEQRVPISFGDWVSASGNPEFGNSVLAVSEGRLSGTEAEPWVLNAAVYATAPIALDRDADGAPKVVASITMPREPGSLRDGRVHVFAVASDGDRSAGALAVSGTEVTQKVAGEAFDTALAAVSGGAGATAAVVNWGDGSPVSQGTVADGIVTGAHTYAEAGTYTVVVTVDDGVRSAEARLEIIVAAAVRS